MSFFQKVTTGTGRTVIPPAGPSPATGVLQDKAPESGGLAVCLAATWGYQRQVMAYFAYHEKEPGTYQPDETIDGSTPQHGVRDKGKGKVGGVKGLINALRKPLLQEHSEESL
ncbi:predicted protein [Histoplasma capsulatum G186AR]|uniref:Uncharacterized protein n=1 Tax=Ajellomyces capsulatus (strain G186AR / H82 / ATCC MYA-2454 / RMSCC 2432) TaxID=447093 RepID=C0NC84_AJECG|nr:uncharacterized protein HCBG_00730 [Histoplasma capsulatum G186AR]EEH11275.1 predicted protein [Histoplasma capsulatum G186AR]